MARPEGENVESHRNRLLAYRGGHRNAIKAEMAANGGNIMYIFMAAANRGEEMKAGWLISWRLAFFIIESVSSISLYISLFPGHFMTEKCRENV